MNNVINVIIILLYKFPEYETTYAGRQTARMKHKIVNLDRELLLESMRNVQRVDHFKDFYAPLPGYDIGQVLYDVRSKYARITRIFLLSYDNLATYGSSKRSSKMLYYNQLSVLDIQFVLNGAIIYAKDNGDVECRIQVHILHLNEMTRLVMDIINYIEMLEEWEAHANSTDVLKRIKLPLFLDPNRSKTPTSYDQTIPPEFEGITHPINMRKHISPTSSKAIQKKYPKNNLLRSDGGGFDSDINK